MTICSPNVWLVLYNLGLVPVDYLLPFHSTQIWKFNFLLFNYSLCIQSFDYKSFNYKKSFADKFPPGEIVNKLCKHRFTQRNQKRGDTLVLKIVITGLSRATPLINFLKLGLPLKISPLPPTEWSCADLCLQAVLEKLSESITEEKC